MNDEEVTCGPDGCEVDIDALMMARYDVDAPGSTVRETGV